MVLLLIFSLYGAEHLMITWEDLLTSTLLKLVVKCIYSQLRLKNMFEVLFIYFFYYCFSASERYSRWGAEWLFRKVTPWNRSFQTAGSPARTEAAQTRIFTAQTKHGRSGMFCWRFALVVVGGGQLHAGSLTSLVIHQCYMWMQRAGMTVSPLHTCLSQTLVVVVNLSL